LTSESPVPVQVQVPAALFISLALCIPIAWHLNFWGVFEPKTNWILYRDKAKELEKQLAALDSEEGKILASNRYVEERLPQVLKKQGYLEDMVGQIEQNLSESKKLREMIYSEGVLPERYRNIVSVASLYQFLENGICTQIKGHGGIYDTYEYHLKLNEIIDNLKKIRQDLRQIKLNQEILYDKLCEIDDTLNKINEGIENMNREMSAHAAIIAESTKRTAMAEEWRNREIWYRS